ncbi:uncharacterized protein I206_100838 [Kwoniella pini CBS 10737]|uniref:BRCT domain-containing protein n=1 Tax=Kwoniella pini CBS 10737 TaxID=1296096 RepID=A0A1B9ICK0_9TREE|nr:uncharacterized protein I206_00488 [Kwoniella pini CBS 10737]OCF53187.1 hypothetical protein I206_00488 [Kwoniella pini CBS 10737]
MTPPRLRRQSSSTTTQPLRTVNGIPNTRSSARLAAYSTSTIKNKLLVYDENAHSPATSDTLNGGLRNSTSTKNLRSRGPLRESKSITNLNGMSIFEDRSSVDGKGKRKLIEEEGIGGTKKVLKVNHTIRSTMGNELKKGRINKIRSVGHQSSSESLRSLEPASKPSTPSTLPTMIRPQTVPAVPTPARELLRKSEGDTTDPADSSFTHIVARPPTPPRMKERSINLVSAEVMPVTPRKEEKREVDKPLSRMPASLRKTPGPSTTSSSLNQNSIPGTPSQLPTAMNLYGPSHTPIIAPSPRKIITTVNSSTTPSEPPPSNKSMMPSTLATPSMRVVPPSPLSSRISSAVKMKREVQPTLDSFLKKRESLMEVDEEETSPFVQALTASNETKPDISTPIDTALDVLKITPNDAQWLDQFDTVHHSLPSEPAPSAAEVPPLPTLTPLSVPKITSTRTLSSMGPPSRIPVSRPSNAPTHIPATTRKADVPSLQKAKPVGILPERRPSTRPSLVPPASLTVVDEASTSPIKRKPSYPSSLGSGPLSKPTQRIVSNPIVKPRSTSNPSPTPDDITESFIQGQRSVSAPIRSRLSLSIREGLNSETSKSLAGLSDALSKLKSKRAQDSISMKDEKPRPNLNILPSISVFEPKEVNERPNNLSISTNSRLSFSGHRPRSSIIQQGDLSISSSSSSGEEKEEENGNRDIGDTSIAALLNSTNGSKCLKGVRAFVDVKTSDGEDSSRIFIDILKGLGARVFVKPSEKLTHIIFKSGKPSTLTWYRKLLENRKNDNEVNEEDKNLNKCLIVGIKWVMECKKSGKRLDEIPYLIDISQEDVFQKRRKSMEPKSLAASQGQNLGLGQPSAMKQALLDVAQAKKRSLMYAPKISSPLKKGYNDIED